MWIGSKPNLCVTSVYEYSDGAHGRHLCTVERCCILAKGHVLSVKPESKLGCWGVGWLPFCDITNHRRRHSNHSLFARLKWNHVVALTGFVIAPAQSLHLYPSPYCCTAHPTSCHTPHPPTHQPAHQTALPRPGKTPHSAGLPAGVRTPSLRQTCGVVRSRGQLRPVTPEPLSLCTSSETAEPEFTGLPPPRCPCCTELRGLHPDSACSCLCLMESCTCPVIVIVMDPQIPSDPDPGPLTP